MNFIFALELWPHVTLRKNTNLWKIFSMMLCVHLRLLVWEGLGRLSYWLYKIAVYCSKDLFIYQHLKNLSRHSYWVSMIQTFPWQYLYLFTTCLHSFVRIIRAHTSVPTQIGIWECSCAKLFQLVFEVLYHCA